MHKRTPAAIVVLLAVALVPRAAAEKPRDDFKKPFSEVWKGRSFGSMLSNERGPVVTWAVLLQDGVTTASIFSQYRKQGESGYECYDTDIRDGRALAAEPEKQAKSKILGEARRGEVFELHSVSFKDGRIDLWLRSVETMRVKRTDQNKNPVEMSEPFCINLRFALPFPPSQKLTAAEAPAALELVTPWLKPARSEDEGRKLARSLQAPAAPVSTAPPPARVATVSPVPARPAGDVSALRKGMSLSDVEALLGKPKQVVDKVEGSLKTKLATFETADATVQATFTEGTLVKYTVSSK